MITVDEAVQQVLDQGVLLDSEKVPINQALGRTLAQDILADRPIPPFNRVAMDGFAVKSSDFTNSVAKLKLADEIAAGDEFHKELQSGETFQIMTGAPCPKGADAIVMVENSGQDGDWVTLTQEGMTPGLNIAKMGEDAPKGKQLLPSGTILNTAGIAICASVGVAEIPVYRQPKIAIISTGTEIIPADQNPLPHQIRDCNSHSSRSLSKLLGIEASFLGIGEDDKEIQREMIKKGLNGDILILSGGVSMGQYDLIPGLLAECGVKKIFHAIKMKPGKPVWFGKTDNNTYVFGLPGNPVSVQVAYKLLVEPLIQKITGNRNPEASYLTMELGSTITIRNPRENFLPGKFELKGDRTVLQQVFLQGSGDFSNVATSHGLIRCPIGVGELEPGSMVRFLPWVRFN